MSGMVSKEGGKRSQKESRFRSGKGLGIGRLFEQEAGGQTETLLFYSLVSGDTVLSWNIFSSFVHFQIYWK